jgi:hypothetical protein
MRRKEGRRREGGKCVRKRCWQNDGGILAWNGEKNEERILGIGMKQKKEEGREWRKSRCRRKGDGGDMEGRP